MAGRDRIERREPGKAKCRKGEFVAKTLKTVENDGDVGAFLDAVESPMRRQDAWAVLNMMKKVTNEEPRMWGTSIVGFGRYTYQRSDGSEHSFMLTGLSPRKSALTIYIMPGFSQYGDLLERLGKHRHSVSCLYLTRLDKIDFEVLTELVSRSVADMRERYSV